ncbi:MAG: hypothetical protein NC314_11625 [Roseburia sp.]|nr:hypothetical protein [Roseburia sp.]MCM1243482.1 hypothetical protein [Roseburia sp.]
MNEERTGKKGYFEEALSDFVFDAAAGGAIRHLVDRGFSVEQIMTQLSYPAPRARVEKAVYRHLQESGILMAKLPMEEGRMQALFLQDKNNGKMAEAIAANIAEYGEENSYMECPFGMWRKTGLDKQEQFLSCLSVREREYIAGIRWEYDIMYHRLNDRMREIGMKLVSHTKWEWGFYFWNVSGTGNFFL